MSSVASEWRSLRSKFPERRAQLGLSLRVTIAALSGFAVSHLLKVPLTPFCLSSGDSGGVDFLATLRDEREDFSREVTLQRSNGVEFGMAFCDPTSNIILGSLIGP